MILADITFDDATMKAVWAYVQWGAFALIPIFTGIGYAIRRGWLSFIGFIKPKVENAFDAHTTLVNTMAEQLPVVSATLSKLGDTQQQQCTTLEQHSKLLELHGGKLDKLLSGHEVKQ